MAPVKKVTPEVRRVLVTFGGADPANMTEKTIRALAAIPGDFQVQIVVGLAYEPRAALRTWVQELGPRFEVREQVRDMSRRIHAADLVITSAGRTVYEVAAIGTPCLEMCQNAREQQHLFALAERIRQPGPGDRRAGRGAARDAGPADGRCRTAPPDEPAGCWRRIFSGGTARIVRLILDSYRDFERKRDTP
jgi:hypothetical protein